MLPGGDRRRSKAHRGKRLRLASCCYSEWEVKGVTSCGLNRTHSYPLFHADRWHVHIVLMDTEPETVTISKVYPAAGFGYCVSYAFDNHLPTPKNGAWKGAYTGQSDKCLIGLEKLLWPGWYTQGQIFVSEVEWAKSVVAVQIQKMMLTGGNSDYERFLSIRLKRSTKTALPVWSSVPARKTRSKT